MDRNPLLFALLAAADQADADYINGGERDTWTKTLSDINDKLSILGLQFRNRPWEYETTTARF